MKPMFLLLCSYAVLAYASAQQRYYYNGNGNPSSTGSWGSLPSGRGVAPLSFTNAGDTFVIANCDTLILTSNWSVTGNGSRIMVGNGTDPVVLFVPTGVVLSAIMIADTLSTLLLQHSIVPVFDSLRNGSTIIYSSDNNQALSNTSYYDLIITGTVAKTATGDLTVRNQLTVLGTLELNAVSENLIVADTSVEGGGTIRTMSSGATPLTPGVHWHCLVDFYRNGVQTIPTGHYRHLSISGSSGTHSASGNLQIDSNLFIAAGVTLAMGSNSLSGDHQRPYGFGTLSTTSSSTHPLPAALTWPVAVSYAAVTGAQYIVSGNYQQLNITSGTNTNYATGDITILDGGTLQVSSGNTLDLLSSALTFAGGASVGGAGIIRTQNTSIAPIPTDQIWTQTVIYNGSGRQTIVKGIYQSLNVNGGDRNYPDSGDLHIHATFTATSSGTHYYGAFRLIADGTGNQTLAVHSGFMVHILYCSGGGTKSITNNLVINTQLQIDSGVALNMGTASLGGTFTINESPFAILRSQSGSALALPSAKTWRLRIWLDGINQYVPSGIYQYGLQLNGGVKQMIGTCSVMDSLLLSQTTLAIDTCSLTLLGSLSGSLSGTLTGGPKARLTVIRKDSVYCELWMNPHSITEASLYALVIQGKNNSPALLLANEVHIVGYLSIASGILYTNGGLIFSPGATIDALNDGAILNGVVSSELAMEGGSLAQINRWRFITTPVICDGYLQSNWQQQIHITGNGQGGSICPNPVRHFNGFDATSSNRPSCYIWNDTLQQWDSILSTNSTKLEAGKGYRIFFRGKRSQGCSLLDGSNTTPQDTILRATGLLNTQSVTFSFIGDSGDYYLIGNPFQSYIDWTHKGVQLNHLSPVYYHWNYHSANGSYAAFSREGSFDSSGGSSRFIAPGEAFFVQSTSNGDATITFLTTCMVRHDKMPAALLVIQKPQVAPIETSQPDSARMHPVFRIDTEADMLILDSGNQWPESIVFTCADGRQIVRQVDASTSLHCAVSLCGLPKGLLIFHTQKDDNGIVGKIFH